MSEALRGLRARGHALSRRLVYGNRFTAAVWLIPQRRRVCRVDASTDLVIDGFWRSGNTYARTALMQVNADAVVASFAHSPYAVRESVRRGVPMMLLVRRPADAVRSYLHYFPDSDAELAIAEYVRYHRAVLPLLDHVMVVRFEEIVADFGEVTARCNQRFGTCFAVYEPSPENDEQVFETIDAGYAGLADFDGKVARPSPGRAALPDALSDLGPVARARMREAEELYSAVVG